MAEPRTQPGDLFFGLTRRVDLGDGTPDGTMIDFSGSRVGRP